MPPGIAIELGGQEHRDVEDITWLSHRSRVGVRPCRRLIVGPVPTSFLVRLIARRPPMIVRVAPHRFHEQFRDATRVPVNDCIK
jgi:hypothetical protein